MRFAKAGVLLLSLLIVSATAGLWIRSIRVADRLALLSRRFDMTEAEPLSGHTVVFEISSCKGIVTVRRGQLFYIHDSWRSTTWLFGTNRQWAWYTVPREVPPGRDNFIPWVRDSFYAILAEQRPWETPHAWRASAPMWLVIVLAGLTPAIWAGRQASQGLRARRRARRGLCRNCGYDLRGGHDRCPECGIATISPGGSPAMHLFRGTRRNVAAVLVVIAVGFSPLALEWRNRVRDAHYQELAENKGWRFYPSEATLDFSIRRVAADCTVVSSPTNRTLDWNEKLIKLTRGGKKPFAWIGHGGTVFVVKDDTLIYADYPQASCGCHVVAVDLKSGKLLWCSGVGPIHVRHSEYNNSVSMDLVNDTVEVWGDESAGRYVSIVDIHSGRVVAQHIFAENMNDW